METGARLVSGALHAGADELRWPPGRYSVRFSRTDRRAGPAGLLDQRTGRGHQFQMAQRGRCRECGITSLSPLRQVGESPGGASRLRPSFSERNAGEGVSAAGGQSPLKFQQLLRVLVKNLSLDGLARREFADVREN